MNSNGSVRGKMLVKLALEDKFAVIADELTVISVGDTLRRADFSTGSLDSNEEVIDSSIVSSYHSEDDFGTVNNRNFCTVMTNQDENICLDNNNGCIVPRTTQTIRNENSPATNISNYIAPPSSKMAENARNTNYDIGTIISQNEVENAPISIPDNSVTMTSLGTRDENAFCGYTSKPTKNQNSQDKNVSTNTVHEYNVPVVTHNVLEENVRTNNMNALVQNTVEENKHISTNEDFATMSNEIVLLSDDLQNDKDATSNIDNYNYSDFSDFESSGSEYFPSTTSVASDTTEENLNISSSILENFKENLDENYQIGEVKKKYSRKNRLTETEKSLPFRSYDTNQPTTSKGVSKQNQENGVSNLKSNLKIGTEVGLCQEIHDQYIKKPSARERPTICPFCFGDVITHFPRHLLRHHKDREEVKKIKELNPKSKERIALIQSLRKQGYFHLKMEKNVKNPVRNSKNPNTNYALCQYCLGDYSKSLLYKHVKQCKSKPVDVYKPGKNCLSNSQTFMASIMVKNNALLRSLRIREEVFQHMIADDISLTAKSDVLICLYGEILLSKHKREQISTLISSKIREMARMLIALRSINPDIKNLFDALKPELFNCIIMAAKIISGYDPQEKSFRAPSLALHMGTNMKIVCSVAYKVVLERQKLPTITWTNFEMKRQEIKDLKKLIEGHWCNEISSLALKVLKERNWGKPIELPLAGDILLFENYIYDQAEKAFENLTQNINSPKEYKILAECVLAHAIMFNRKRVGDVQYLTIETYIREIPNTEQEAFTRSLTEVEKILSRQFKRVVTGGKGSKPVPILFNKKMQKYINYLLQIREIGTIVPKSNPYLFANPGSEKKWMIGVKVISKLAKNCGAERPTLLTSTKFRKHIATTLQLLNMQPEEMEQLATFMGHTKKTHAEFYRLPQDIYQTVKVAKVLLLLEKGRGEHFQGKTINEIQLQKDIYYSSNSSEDEDEEEGNTVVKKLCKRIKDRNLSERKEESLKEQTATDLHLSEEKRQEDDRKKIDTMQICEDNLMDSNESGTHEVTDPENYSSRTNKKRRRINTKKADTVNTSEDSLDSNESDSDEVTELKSHASRMNIKQKKKHKNESSKEKRITGRIRWLQKEKDIVLKYFEKHVQNKITPKKHECNQFLVRHGKELNNKDWIRVKTFVYNTFKGN